MMYAVGNPEAFKVNFESLPVFALAADIGVLVNGLQAVSDQEIVAVILIVNDIPPPKGCFGKIVNQFFLPQT